MAYLGWYPGGHNQLEERLPLASYPDMANVEAFKAFLRSRQTGLAQRSPEWLKARQNTIGASKISALTGYSPFENSSSLIRKKTRPADMSRNVACTWGFLFEPIVRGYFEQKHSVKVFGHMMSLNLAKDHPLYGKVTCSPDGYFSCKDGPIALLEFKCPYKRKIVVNKPPRQYADQIQTGLALSGKSVNKGLYVDACFRMCSFKQLGLGLEHNSLLNGGVVHSTKRKSALACGICLLSSTKRLYKNQSALIDLGATESTALFEGIMRRISSKEILINPFSSYVEFEDYDHCDELDFLKIVNEKHSQKSGLQSITSQWSSLHGSYSTLRKSGNTRFLKFLESLQTSITTFHKKLEREKTRQANPVKTIPNTLKDDSAMLESFLRDHL